MRTLKKALSLVLVLAMVLTLGVSAFAVEKAADYSDYADVKNTEAVAVLTAIGVLNGNDDGTFGPEGNFTRAQAAKMICYMTLGKTLAEALPAGATQFNDVPATHWAAKYIQYCANEGIIGGNGDGTFAPDGVLTASAWSKMLLCALGYKAETEGMTGTGWEINTTKLAISAKVATAEDLAGAFNRDAAAKLALNTLKADMVWYDGGSKIVVNGVEIVNGAQLKKVEDALSASKGNIDTTGDVIQLAEKSFPKLVLTATAGYGTDDFGRTVKTWLNNGKPVATAATAAAFTYTATTTDTQIAKDLKGYTFNTKVLVDKDTQIGAGNTANIGELTFSNATDKIAAKVAALTGNGKLVEIYADTNKAITNVVVVSYYVGRIDAVSTNTKGDVTYTINSTTDTVYADKDAGTDGIKFVGFTPAKGDVVTYTDENGTRYVYPTTNFDGKMTKYNQTAASITVDGSVYKTGTVDGVTNTGFTAATAFTGTSNSKFYVDQYGYVVAVNGINDTKYAVIDSIALVSGSGVEGSSYVEAKVVFVDGKTEVVKVASIDGYNKAIVAGTDLSSYKTTSGGSTAATSSAAVGKISAFNGTGNTTENKFLVLSNTASANDSVFKNKVYTYSIDANGKYVLVTDGTVTGGSATLKKGIPAVVDGKVANDNTTYVVKTKSGTNDVWNVYTGYKSMPTMASAGVVDAAVTADGVVFVYVDATSVSSMGDTTSDVAFFFANAYTVDNTDPTKPLYEYTAVLNGELKTVVATSDLSVSSNTLYKVTLNENGQVTAVSAASGAKFNSVTANGNPAAKGGVLTIDSATINTQASVTSLTYSAETVVYFVHTVSKTVNTGSMESIADDAAIYVKTVGTVDNTADNIAVATAYVLVAD